MILYIRMTISLFLLLLLSSFSYATDTKSALPPDLIFHDKPIDPLCFFEMPASGYFVSLDHCGIKAEPGRQVIAVNKNLTKQGFTGYDYTWLEDEDEINQLTSYSYYKVIGHFNDIYIIYTINSTGKDGRYSSIYFLKRRDKNLFLKLVVIGDRCNGGINYIQFRNNQLVFNINLTSHKLFQLSEQITHSPFYADNLPNCPTCCKVTANYTINTNWNSSAKLEYIDLGSKMLTIKNDSTDTLNYCFDKILLKQQKSGQRYLPPSYLSRLMREFTNNCNDYRPGAAIN